MRLSRSKKWLILDYTPAESCPGPALSAIGGYEHYDEQQWLFKANYKTFEKLMRLLPGIEVDPELLEDMRREWRFREKEVASLKALPDFEITDFVFKTEPSPYQRVGLEFLRRSRRALLLDPTGTGKTKTMIDYATWLMLQKQVDYALVLCPKTLLYNWAEEIEKHSDLTNISIARGTEKSKLKALAAKPNFYITNWEAMRTKSVHKRIVELTNGRCILLGDECHKIKSYNSTVSKKFQSLYCDYMVLATATLVVNDEKDVYPALNAVALKWPGWTNFAGAYCRPGYFGGWDIKKRELGGLIDLVDKYSIRRDKKQLLPFLPEKQYKRIDVELSPKTATAYNNLGQTFMHYFKTPEAIPSTALTELLRLTEITSGFLRAVGKVEYIGNEKFEALAEIIKDVVDDRKEKVTIWCRFQPTIDRLMEIYGKAPYNAVYIDGRINDPKERMAIVSRFQNDPEIKIFIGQISAAGLGINLYSNVPDMPCATAIMLEHNWPDAEAVQAEDRIHRRGQTAEAVRILNIIATGTVDEYIVKVKNIKHQKEMEMVPISKIIKRDDLQNYLQIKKD